MSRRQGGWLEALFNLASRLPWWLSLTLAVASYHGLGLLASRPLPELSELPTAPPIIVHFLHWFAIAGQYILPFAFSVGAIASILVALRGKQIYRRISKTPNRQSLDGLRWREFEILMLEWFRKQGFTVQDTDLGPDGGVDIVLRKDGRTYLVQCKHWRAYKVGVTVVRELRGVMASEGAAGGFVVTSGIFTDEARRFASRNDITLIDGRQLTAVIKQHKTAVLASREPAALAADIHGIAEPTCPQCGAGMVERKASRGPAAGGYFWGCSRYPSCRGTRSARARE
jgi:restriction system protein